MALYRLPILICAAALLAWTNPHALIAQGSGVVEGTVSDAEGGKRLRGVSVSVKGTSIGTFTDIQGAYTLDRVPAGPQIIVVDRSDYITHEIAITVSVGAAHALDAMLQAEPIPLDAIVTTVSRLAEPIGQAAASISAANPAVVRDLAITSQAPRVLAFMPGLDVVQNGMSDYNVNARGFNSSISRRFLVLRDGRDVALSLTGATVWSAMTGALDEDVSIEVVRGPSSALYGANAAAGVINFTTKPTNKVRGTKAALGAGGLGTIRGDIRHAGVFANERLGYKVNLGYNRGHTWSVPRTRFDGGDLRREYAEVSDDPVPDNIEVIPFQGQTLDPATGSALGDPDDVINAYGSVRLDLYQYNGRTLTAEGGSSFHRNEVYLLGGGRLQAPELRFHWGRLEWSGDRFDARAWYSGEYYAKPVLFLASGVPAENQSSVVQGELQYNRPLFGDRGHMVIGASVRNYFMDTKGTVLPLGKDDRSDGYYSMFGHFEYGLLPELRLVGAARYDASDLFDPVFSPKGALVYSLNDSHTVRVTVSRAYLAPTQPILFLNIAGPLVDFGELEADLRASPIGPDLAGVPDGELFDNSAEVPILYLGNEDLDNHKISSFELGYQGWIADRALLTIDVYRYRLTDFVTDLLPGFNPAYAKWTSPDGVPEPTRKALAAAVRDQLLDNGQRLEADGLTRLPDGSTAIVLSYGNVGIVDEWGIEVGGALKVSAQVRLEGTYSLFQADIDLSSLPTGAQLYPNTPKHKGTLSVSYTSPRGVDVRLNARLVSGYHWSAGLFAGPIPSSQTVDLSAGYQISPRARFNVVATNLFDQPRYHAYGGSVIGRRVLVGITYSF